MSPLSARGYRFSCAVNLQRLIDHPRRRRATRLPGESRRLPPRSDAYTRQNRPCSSLEIDAPRSFSDNGLLKVERGYSETVRRGLSDLGHKVEVPAGPIGGGQSITSLESGVLTGASDPRKDGCAIGY